MQTREQLISSILAYGMKMEAIFLEANIKLSYVRLPEDRDKVPTVLIEEALDWLKNIHDKEYQDCLKTKALIPADQWEFYKFLGMDGAREVEDLKKNFRDLRKKVISKERPAAFRKKRFNAPRKKADVQGTDQGEAQVSGGQAPSAS